MSSETEFLVTKFLRLDQHLVELGAFPTRSKAKSAIERGLVFHKQFRGASWQECVKPAQQFEPGSLLLIRRDAESQFVSRAGLKLANAISRASVDVKGRVCLDLGQSTGGFSDCLLQQGAKRVIGIDVGHGQLSATLRANPKLVCLEGINARHMSSDVVLKYTNLGFDLVVMDVSFISQTLIHPKLGALMRAKAPLLSLVKPQFELSPQKVGKGGIVRDASLYKEVELHVKESLAHHGFEVKDYFESSIKGTDGNKEFFVIAESLQRPMGSAE